MAQTPYPRRHRRPSPSPSTLLLFASIFASTSATGHPLSRPSPPDFLCPHLSEFEIAVPGPSSYIQALPTPTVKRKQARAVPDSYSKGGDGRWRKLSQYSFYGSTICLCDDDSVSSSSLYPDILTASPPSGTSDVDSLPTGWSSSPQSSAARTSLILTLSMILAGIIAVFISSCIYWRKRRKLRAEKDPEKKTSSRRSVEFDEKEDARVKLWVRASARWRDNVKHSARRRRTSRLVSSLSHLGGSSVSLARPSSPSPSNRSHHPSILCSRTSTPRPSSVLRESIDEPELPVSDESVSVHSQNDPSPFPPAYQGGGGSGPSIPKSPSIHESSDPNSHAIDPPSVSDEEGRRYTPALHSAHVATDDKAVLQRMGIMGSEPPDAVGGSDRDQGSAPVLYDDDVDESLARETHLERDIGEVSPSVMFPAPPEPQASSKGKMVQYLDYEDMDVELPSGPSAPPFDASLSGPSAPLLDGDVGEAMIPFAPSLEELEMGSVPPVEEDVDVAGGGGSQPGPSMVLGRSQPESLPRYQP